MPNANDQSELTLYQTDDGTTRIHVRLFDGTVWLSQKQLAELYQVSVPTTYHASPLVAQLPEIAQHNVDRAFDLDVSAAIAFHQESQADLSLVGHRLGGSLQTAAARSRRSGRD